MLPEFANYVQAIFPSINPALAKQLISAAAKYPHIDADCFSKEGERGPIVQGDIISALPFVVQEKDGSFGRALRSGMLLSHSCDFDNDEWVTFAACHPFPSKASSASAMRANRVTSVFFLPMHEQRGDVIVQLSQLQTLRTSFIRDALASGLSMREDGLSLIGYYYLITKLAVHQLRPYPEDEGRGTATLSFVERLRYAATLAANLPRYVTIGRA